nr:PREDICTED: transcription factor 21-like [Bos indicus]
MSTGSLSDVEDLQEVEMLDCDGLKMDSNKEFVTSNESTEESSNCEAGSPQKGRGGLGKRRKAPTKKSPLSGVSQEGKQVQRNAANARERARMRVLSKAFSRLKTTLPWVPPDTKLSKLDTLRLASSYIAHLRQILANDKYENGYIHPVNLDPPLYSPDKFLVSTEFLRALSQFSPATTPGVGKQRVGFLPAEALAASPPDTAKGKGV